MSNKMVNYTELRDSANNGLNVRDEFKNKTVDELQEISKNTRLNYDVVLLNVTGDINISTMIRTSHLFGARRIHMLGRKKYDKRGTVGAQNYVDIVHYPCLEDDGITIDADLFFNYMVDNKLFPMFIEHGGIMLDEMNWHSVGSINSTMALVFGCESTGIPDKVLDLGMAIPNANIISIPQTGIMRSFNVSTSHGIVLWDMCRSLNLL